MTTFLLHLGVEALARHMVRSNTKGTFHAYDLLLFALRTRMTGSCVMLRGRSCCSLVKPRQEPLALAADLAFDLALVAATRLHLDRHLHELHFDLALLFVEQDLRVGRETLPAVVIAALKRPASLRT